MECVFVFGIDSWLKTMIMVFCFVLLSQRENKVARVNLKKNGLTYQVELIIVHSALYLPPSSGFCN